jgi:hypothetical protein
MNIFVPTTGFKGLTRKKHSSNRYENMYLKADMKSWIDFPYLILGFVDFQIENGRFNNKMTN